MEYKCVDLGSERCPCNLMESGQCYMCNLIKTGKCNCSSSWQGVCPYNEYLQYGKKTTKNAVVRIFKIYKIKSYSPTLTVITIETPIAFALKSRELGAFLMLNWKSWFVPISVLRVTLEYENQVGYIDLAVNATGPKTIGLLKASVVGQELMVKGPFYSGVLGRKVFQKNVESIIIAKGIAVMPLINIKDKLKGSVLYFGLDTSKLPQAFLDKYLKDIAFEKIDLEKDIFEISENIKERYGYYMGAHNEKPNIFFMMSPHYIGRLLSLSNFNENKVILPNHSNMCCGEGVCGSCSYTDEKGVTVKKCKCID